MFKTLMFLQHNKGNIQLFGVTENIAKFFAKHLRVADLSHTVTVLLCVLESITVFNVGRWVFVRVNVSPMGKSDPLGLIFTLELHRFTCKT